MTPYYADDWLTVYHGDALTVLAELPAESAHCVVTSPPYWGLRDYGTATWTGGDAECDHVERNARDDAARVRKVDAQSGRRPAAETYDNGSAHPFSYRNVCGKCGATRVDSQLGLEATPEAYVTALVGVFREVRRVLRSDGTVWLNLGDSYAGSEPGRRDTARLIARSDGSAAAPSSKAPTGRRGNVMALAGLKPKDLVGIPWMVAFALRADGWYLRSDIIWSKPNPMPESVTDRPTKSHEYLFLLAKGQWKSRVVQVPDLPSERLHLGQDFGAEGTPVRAAAEFAVRLASAIADIPKPQQDLSLRALDAEIGQQGSTNDDGVPVSYLPVEHRASVLAARLLRSDITPKEFLSELQSVGVALTDRHHLRVCGIDSEVPLPPGVAGYGEGTIAIHHPGEVRKFDLVHNTIIVARPSTCTYYFDADAVREPGDPWAARHPDSWATGMPNGHDTVRWSQREPGAPTAGTGEMRSGRNIRSVWTVATAPYPGAHFATFPPKLIEPCIKAGCPEGGTVLDMFAGSGTTGMVAQSLSRRAVLIDLSMDYLGQLMDRNRDIPLGLGA